MKFFSVENLKQTKIWNDPKNQQLVTEATDSMRQFWTDPQITALRALYSDTGGIDIDRIAGLLGKSRASVACKAHEIGLTTRRGHHISPARVIARQNRAEKERNKPSPEQQSKLLSDRQKAYLALHGHPRGMLGKHHSDKTKATISAFHKDKKVPREVLVRRLKTTMARYGRIGGNQKGRSWKCGWVTVGETRFFARSRWEANYARYLEFLKTKTKEITAWQHEPKTFWFDGVKRGCVSYLPDFKVNFWDGREEYHEVKGWMDARSVTKIRRMAKYFPEIVLTVIDAPRYGALSRQCRRLIPGWE